MLDMLRDGVVYGDLKYAQDFALLNGLVEGKFVNGTIEELYDAGVLYVVIATFHVLFLSMYMRVIPRNFSNSALRRQ